MPSLAFYFYTLTHMSQYSVLWSDSVQAITSQGAISSIICMSCPFFVVPSQFHPVDSINSDVLILFTLFFVFVSVKNKEEKLDSQRQNKKKFECFSQIIFYFGRSLYRLLSNFLLFIIPAHNNKKNFSPAGQLRDHSNGLLKISRTLQDLRLVLQRMIIGGAACPVYRGLN
jgi:hypothetical protein